MPSETEHYLASLPKGLASFPECRAKADVTRMILDDVPELLKHEAVPPEIGAALRGISPADVWIPDTVGTCARLLVYDIRYKQLLPYLAWNFELSGRVYKRPLYRALMYVMSPSLVVSNATKRWEAFRQGTRLEGKVKKGEAEMFLRHPRGLYPPLMAQALGESFRAALAAAGAKDIVLEVGATGQDGTPYTVRWT